MAIIRSAVVTPAFLLALAVAVLAQQNTLPVQQNAGQASQPAAASNGPGTGGADIPSATAPSGNTVPPAANAAGATDTSAPASGTSSVLTRPTTVLQNSANADDNPYDPLLEPPPLPKGRTTLVGGTATTVDHVRNHLTVQPFGGGRKLKVFVDERSHIYRNGVETTVLGIHKGDRVYVDTMLDGDKIFARNVRVITQTGLAEVRGQVISANPEKGTISVRDQLSARPVTFAVGGATKYSSSKGAATAADVQPGSLIDVQFSPRRDDRDVAEEVIVLAKPGDNYIFSGVVTNLDMRTNSFFVDNKSDDQTYEVHFSPAAASDARALKIGSEVTARTTFDGKQYTANNVRIEGSKQPEGEESKAQ
ncbi:MAG: hypothetical protein ACLPPV_16880 [Candidatus Korobacteraceae bacterium]